MRDTWENRLQQDKQKVCSRNKTRKCYSALLVYFLLVNVCVTLFIPQSQSVEDSGFEPPIACFSWNPDEPTNGQPILFDASCSYQPEGCVLIQPLFQIDLETSVPSRGVDLQIPVSILDDEDESHPPGEGDQGGFQQVLPREGFYGCETGESGYELVLPHIQSYFWNFGDGNTSTEQTPLHTYEKPGEYAISLTVVDNRGQESTTFSPLVVRHNPFACIDLITPQPALPGSPVLFVGHGEDTSGFIINYSWHSSIDGVLSSQPSFTTSNLSTGIHHISFRVQNNSFVWSETIQETLIVNALPNAQAGSPYFGWLNESVLFNGSASSDTDGVIIQYQWDFGDGTTDTGVHVTHTYTDIGLYTVTLTITDDLGGTDTDVTIARIVGAALIAHAGGPYHSYKNQTIVFNGSKSFSAIGNITSYEWDFGDGTSGTGETQTHCYEHVGTYRVTLLVTNQDGQQDMDSTSATISDIFAPSPPEVQGVTHGKINQEYIFWAISYDPAEDMISYVFKWGDTTQFTSPFFPSGTLVSTSHTWNHPGTYVIQVYALGNQTISSEPTTVTIIITEDNRSHLQTNDTQSTFLAFISGLINDMTARNFIENKSMVLGLVSIAVFFVVLVFFRYKRRGI